MYQGMEVKDYTQLGDDDLAVLGIVNFKLKLTFVVSTFALNKNNNLGVEYLLYLFQFLFLCNWIQIWNDKWSQNSQNFSPTMRSGSLFFSSLPFTKFWVNGFIPWFTQLKGETLPWFQASSPCKSSFPFKWLISWGQLFLFTAFPNPRSRLFIGLSKEEVKLSYSYLTNTVGIRRTYQFHHPHNAPVKQNPTKGLIKCIWGIEGSRDVTQEHFLCSHPLVQGKMLKTCAWLVFGICHHNG